MQGGAKNRECFETSHKNRPAPNVGLEPSCSTDWTRRTPYALNGGKYKNQNKYSRIIKILTKWLSFSDFQPLLLWPLKTFAWV